MKNFLFLLMLAPLALVANPPAEDLPTMDRIIKAISAGDAATLSGFFDETVELSILEEEDIYSKAEATAVVKKFFTGNAPSGYSQVHEGTSKGNDSRYSIGNLKAGGKTFRVYVYTKEAGGKVLIQELRFDAE